LPTDYENFGSLKKDNETEELSTWNQSVFLLKRNSDYLDEAQKIHYGAAFDMSISSLLRVFHAVKHAYAITRPYMSQDNQKKIDKAFDKIARKLREVMLASRDGKIKPEEHSEIHNSQYDLIFDLYEYQKMSGLGIPTNRREPTKKKLNKTMKVRGGTEAGQEAEPDDNP